MDSTPEADFPSSESFVDCAGERRHFELEVRHLPNHGYAAEARGEAQGGGASPGPHPKNTAVNLAAPGSSGLLAR